MRMIGETEKRAFRLMSVFCTAYDLTYVLDLIYTKRTYIYV